jgi:hypothetical protein
MAGQDVPVAYSGPVDRLGTPIDSASLGFLEWFLRARAQNMGASFEARSEGDYGGSAK